MRTQGKFLTYIGNILIGLSIFVFIFIFYPLLQVYLIPPKVGKILPTQGTYITIPKISAQAQITENVDPFNSDEYREILKRSVAHAKNTSLPGQDGTIYLFAHSSGSPWEITRYNTIFLRLSELNIGDTIIVQRNNKRYKYLVHDKKEIDPSEVNYILNTKKTQLILQTCTPIGTDWKRLLIFAMPINT